MAATAVYVNIVRVPDAAVPGDSQSFSNIAATTSAFQLKGGTYTIDVVATFGGGSVTLQRLGPDASTYLTAAAAFSANGTANATLPQGTYKVAIA
jgi:hypothetical protein